MRTRALSLAAALLLMAGIAMAQKAKSKKELDAFMAIQNEPNLDLRIQKVDEFITKFADTELKAQALYLAADAAQRKGDTVKALVYGQSALDANPKDYQAMLLMSGELARSTHENDLDKNDKLARAEKLANDAITTINTAPKPNPSITDEQWASAKKDLISEGHVDLGMIATDRKNLDVAVTEFKTAVDDEATPDSVTMVRLAQAYVQTGKLDEALDMANKVLAMPNVPDAVKRFAQVQKARAEQAKNAKK